MDLQAFSQARFQCPHNIELRDVWKNPSSLLDTVRLHCCSENFNFVFSHLGAIKFSNIKLS